MCRNLRLCVAINFSLLIAAAAAAVNTGGRLENIPLRISLQTLILLLFAHSSLATNICRPAPAKPQSSCSCDVVKILYVRVSQLFL